MMEWKPNQLDIILFLWYEMNVWANVNDLTCLWKKQVFHLYLTIFLLLILHTHTPTCQNTMVTIELPLDPSTIL